MRMNLWHGFILLAATLALAAGCGMSVHNEVARRATHWFNPVDHPEYLEVIAGGQSWIQPGTFYPDWGYVCSVYYDQAEYSHFPRFLNATATVIKATYPKPWSRDVQNKIAFLLGIMAHSVADISWHSLGLEDALLQSLAEIEKNDAHSIMDNGGEFITKHFSDLDYIETRWYTPAADLVRAHELSGITPVPTEEDINRCMKTGFLGATANKIAGELLYRYAKDSPGVIEMIQNYFLGGINDMAAWTQLCWADIINWLETDSPRRPMCKIEENRWGSGDPPEPPGPSDPPGPSKSLINMLRPKFSPEMIQEQDKIEQWLNQLGFIITSGRLPSGDVFTEIKHQNGQGVEQWIREQSDATLKKLAQEKLLMKNRACVREESLVRRRFSTSVPYGQFGYQVEVGDFNADGIEDLAISAPFYGGSGEAQRGAVFIVNSADNGQVSDQVEEIEQAATVILKGPVPYGRFGFGLAVVDLNGDGIDDLAVSAPTAGFEELHYNGAVYVYFGSYRGLATEPDIVLTVSQLIPEPIPEEGSWTWNFRQTVLGTTLDSADVDNDGAKDLIIGSPFASPSEDGRQRGQVLIFKSSSRHSGSADAVKSADIVLTGEEQYGWFGYAVSVTKLEGRTLLLVGSPTHNPNRENVYNGTTPSVGKLFGYDITTSTPTLRFTLTGSKKLTKFGSNVVVGDFLLNNQTYLAVSTPSESNGDRWQAGSIRIIELSQLRGNIRLADVSVYATIRGNENSGLFGTGAFKIVGSELWVGEPLYGALEDVRGGLGLETGRILSFLLGTRFPQGTVLAEEVAAQCIIGQNAKERFGSSATKFSQTSSMVIGSPHAYALGRLNGEVAILSQ